MFAVAAGDPTLSLPLSLAALRFHPVGNSRNKPLDFRLLRIELQFSIVVHVFVIAPDIIGTNLHAISGVGHFYGLCGVSCEQK